MTKTAAAHSDDITLITKAQLAKRWSCSIMKVHRMMRAGTLPYILLGRSVRFDLEDVKKVEARGRVNGFAA
ncbi:helix-turn-helix domain-containing protein [Verrucomicrobium sp. BvORR106]|uniref:helix-turn-helix transcriptional regulator n=1 Tax=Verrucomicrobium sp. BvORR106 TaxID=1403819 RepID=UPI0005719A16|nr:helix-turn-helix domain-containing protein [Verrucomicrobium sp. BvORR106]